MWLVPSTQAARQTSKPNLKSINHSKLLIQIYLWLPLLCTQDPGRGIGFTLTCAPSRGEEEEEEDFHFVSSLHSSQIMPITSESSILKMTNCTNMPEVFFLSCNITVQRGSFRTTALAHAPLYLLCNTSRLLMCQVCGAAISQPNSFRGW